MKYGFSGDKKYQRRARQALPILVRQARAEEPIFYSDLARELKMPNPRNLNDVLGAIGNELLMLSEKWDVEVPPIQALVVNKQTELPGEGIAWFAPDAEDFEKATLSQRRNIVQNMLTKVYTFDQWSAVLYHFGLEMDTKPSLPFLPGDTVSVPRGGESALHRELKNAIAENPSLVGLRKSLGPGQVEFHFGSGDAIDVLFRDESQSVGVEVKTADASVVEVARGLFQCVKYRALLESTLKVEQRPINGRVLLALGGSLPDQLIGLRNTLGVEVVDAIAEAAK